MKFIGSFLFIYFAVNLFGAEAYLKNKTILEGEKATLVIHIKGENIHLKRIYKIAGLSVVDHDGHFETNIINGKKIKDIYYEITFYPKKSMTIPPLEFRVNGKKESTNSVNITVQENPNKPFIFETFANNNSPIKNEIIKFSLRFKYKDKIILKDSKFTKPDFSEFWLEGIRYIPAFREGDYKVLGIDYFLTAKTTGNIEIGKSKFEAIEEASSFGEKVNFSNYKRTFTSKPFKLTINPMPVETDIVGNFSINTIVDKTVIEGNEMVQVFVKVKGKGNFNDIEPFLLNLNNATSTTSDPIIQIYPQNDTMEGSFTQKFYIGNAQGDFIIPPFKLSFYNLQTKSIQTIKSKPISIEVKNPIIKNSIRGGKEEFKTDTKKGSQMYSLNLLIGFLLGIISILILQMIKKKNFSKKIVNPKNHKLLLQKLFAYKGESNNIDLLIEKLESKLYKNQKITISNKEIKNVLKYMANK